MPDDRPGRSVTNRGFAVYDQFVDHYGSEVRVQKSSLASEPAVWIFAQRDGKDESALLTLEQAKRVRDALDSFIAENKDEPNNTAEVEQVMLEAFAEMEAKRNAQ